MSETRGRLGGEYRPWRFSVLVLTSSLALLLVSSGCDDAPGADVPDSTMVAALTDLHLLDARRERYGDMQTGDAQMNVDSLRQALLATHGLDTTALNEALGVYAADAPRLRAVYDSVIVRVNAAHRSAAQAINQ